MELQRCTPWIEQRDASEYCTSMDQYIYLSDSWHCMPGRDLIRSSSALITSHVCPGNARGARSCHRTLSLDAHANTEHPKNHKKMLKIFIIWLAHVYTYSIGSTGAPHCPALGTNDAFSFGALVRLFSIRWLEDHHFGFTKTVTVQKD